MEILWLIHKEGKICLKIALSLGRGFVTEILSNDVILNCVL